MTGLWADRDFLCGVQYRTDRNLAARQSIDACQHPPIDLPARVLDLAAPSTWETVADVGCGNGAYLAELARRGCNRAHDRRRLVGRPAGRGAQPGALGGTAHR
jgi:SAM-dependent methyltransferase